MTELIPIILFTVSTALTPGPNNLMIMNAGMNFGLKRSLPHYFGICIGFPVMVLMVALGLGAVFIEYSWIKQGLKIIGSIYMLYLALQLLTAHTQSGRGTTQNPFSFLRAVLFQWVNPKAWLMAISAISIFTITINYLTNAISISVLYLLICIPCAGIWLLGGKFLQKVLKKDSHRLWFNRVMALSLAASIAMIFFD